MLIDECFGLIGEIRKVGAANQTLLDKIIVAAIYGTAFLKRRHINFSTLPN
jgi:hypothetical protein